MSCSQKLMHSKERPDQELPISELTCMKMVGAEQNRLNRVMAGFRCEPMTTCNYSESQRLGANCGPKGWPGA